MKIVQKIAIGVVDKAFNKIRNVVVLMIHHLILILILKKLEVKPLVIVLELEDRCED